jgi:hypothetical protein
MIVRSISCTLISNGDAVMFQKYSIYDACGGLRLAPAGMWEGTVISRIDTEGEFALGNCL